MIGSGLLLGFRSFFPDHYKIYAATRKNVNGLEHLCHHYICDIDIVSEYEKVICEIKPDYVINCIGIVSQLAHLHSNAAIIQLNSIWPQLLKELAEKNKFKLIQISTDCVFDGKSGSYYESDKAFAHDLYGTTKRLGEVFSEYSMTIRCSTIGFELGPSAHGLFEWFLRGSTDVDGYKHAFYNGVCTPFLAKFIHQHIEAGTTNRIVHCVGHRISKYHLLQKINDIFVTSRNINGVDTPRIDRTLASHDSRNQLEDSWDVQLETLRSIASGVSIY